MTTRYACPHCSRLLRNKSGLTQHLHSVHTIRTHLRQPTEPPESQGFNADFTADPVSHTETGLPPHDRYMTEFHPQLDGSADLTNTRHTFLLTLSQVGLATSLETFFLAERLHHHVQRQSCQSGHHSRINSNLKPPTSYSAMLNYQQRKSILCLTFGPHHYSTTATHHLLLTRISSTIQ
jgi:hypothetical protein